MPHRRRVSGVAHLQIADRLGGLIWADNETKSTRTDTAPFGLTWSA
jgi:hypothetical protein